MNSHFKIHFVKVCQIEYEFACLRAWLKGNYFSDFLSSRKSDCIVTLCSTHHYCRIDLLIKQIS